MIYKSFQVENNISILNKKVTLFYGENAGLVDDFKKLLKEKDKNILSFTENDLLSNNESFINEIINDSLFEAKKIFFIQNATDKSLKIIQEVIPKLGTNEMYLFAGILEKKSKLRKYFEVENNLNIVPCYQDNEISLKKIILSNLKDYSGIDTQLINFLIENSSNSRSKLGNELIKIKSYFVDKVIKIDALKELLNSKEDENFDLIKDTALSGNKEKTNQLLNSTMFDIDRSIFYIAAINQRLLKLKEILKKDVVNIEKSMSEIKPPIFWKDKSTFLFQAKKWNTKKINNILNKTYNLELMFKSNSLINKDILIKKLLIDICENANS